MGTPLRVLIVEDSEGDTLLLLRELRQGGYDCTYERVETATAMASALNEKSWDVIIADQILPHFSGTEALGILKEKGIDLPFILVSGKITEDLAVAFLKGGAHDFITKGNLARLVPAIQRELKEASIRQKKCEAEAALRQETEDLALLDALNQAANRGKSLQEMTEQLAEETRRTFSSYGVAVYFLGEDRQTIDVQAISLPQAEFSQIERLISGKIPPIKIPLRQGGIYSRTIAENKPRLITALDTIRTLLEEFTEQAGLRKLVPRAYELLSIRSIIQLPLISDGKFIGLLDLSSRETMGETHLRRLERVSEQLTAIIRRKRAEEEAAAHSQRLGILHEVSVATGQSMDTATIASIVLHKVLAAAGLDAGTVRYLDQSGDNLALLASDTLPAGLAKEVQVHPSITPGKSLAGSVLQSRSIQIVEDITQGISPFYGQVTQLGFQSCVGVPLQAKGQVVGVLSAFSRRTLALTAPDLDMLTDLGNMLGTSLFNANLFEKVEAKAREWEKTFDAMSSGILILDRGQVILKANAAIAEMVSTTPKELVGKHCFEVIHGAKAPIAECPFHSCVSERRKLSLVRQEGHMGNRWLHFLVAPMNGTSHEVQGVVHVLTDITDLKTAEGEIKKRNEELEHKVRELSALNTMFQKNLNIRFASEEALGRVLDGLKKILEETEKSLHRAESQIPQSQNKQPHEAGPADGH